MKKLQTKVAEIKSALKAANLTNADLRGRSTGCPMVSSMDAKLVKEFLLQGMGHGHIRASYNIGLIGNNGHAGSIIENCKDISNLAS